MAFTNRVSEEVEFLGAEHADTQAAGAITLGFFSMGLFRRMRFLLDVGDMVATSTLDAQVRQATDAAGTGSKALDTNRAITQLTAAGGDGNDSIDIAIRAEELDTNNDFEFVALVITVAVADVEYNARAEGWYKRYKPVVITGLAEVVEG